MEFKVWLIGQIAIDAVMFVLVMVILRIHLKRRASLEMLEGAVNDSESFLSEMKAIGLALEENLNEKRELSSHVLSEMDKKLDEAKTLSKKLESIISESRNAPAPDRSRRASPIHDRESIKSMLAKGLTKEEVSKYLHIPSGELELILKIQTPSEKESR